MMMMVTICSVNDDVGLGGDYDKDNNERRPVLGKLHPSWTPQIGCCSLRISTNSFHDKRRWNNCI